MDQHTNILPLIADDLIDQSVSRVGRIGLSVENIFRCLILKQQLGISYVQSTIRNIKLETLEKLHELLSVNWLEQKTISMDKIRIDCTVVKSNIAPPSDSQLLEDYARVLSRLL